MASLQTPPPSPHGLPTSPRATRQMLSPLRTTFPVDHSTSTSTTPTSTVSSAPTLVTPQRRLHSPSSLIFINATIPLSPASSTFSASSPRKSSLYEGLEPRKRSGFARLFSCFGIEERARRKREREVHEFEMAGCSGHWSEY